MVTRLTPSSRAIVASGCWASRARPHRDLGICVCGRRWRGGLSGWGGQQADSEQAAGVAEAEDGVVVTARTQTTSAVCYQCGTPTGRRHSRYRRRLHDLAAGGRPVLILLEVSRFFCDNPSCERRT
ncbi:transposase family protein [Actinomadura rugatobispora]|uniref:Transposase family protein n=1 Tax=Actinomadura rugatobispora TaxID=1994 RepID=A0ABW0ZYS5_9ACTN